MIIKILIETQEIWACIQLKWLNGAIQPQKKKKDEIRLSKIRKMEKEKKDEMKWKREGGDHHGKERLLHCLQVSVPGVMKEFIQTSLQCPGPKQLICIKTY